jgi:MFS family permease
LVRALAFLGNAFLLLLPLTLFISSRRPDEGFFIMTAYCVIVALASAMALAFRDRFSFWAALGANLLAILLAAALLVYFAAEGERDWAPVLFIAVPAALNLLAVLLVRRSRGPSDDTVATRR